MIVKAWPHLALQMPAMLLIQLLLKCAADDAVMQSRATALIRIGLSAKLRTAMLETKFDTDSKELSSICKLTGRTMSKLCISVLQVFRKH